MKSVFLLICPILLFGYAVSGQEVMTVERFKEIVATPGDSTPLSKRLAAAPFWSKAVCSNSMQYADGRILKEECSITAKTVQGRYIVSTMDSRYYKQPMHAILEYDEKSQAYKLWALFDATVTEARLVFDFERKVSAGTATYQPGFMEISVGTFSDKESSEHVVTYKDGVLFLTRDSKVRPANGTGTEGGDAASQSPSRVLGTNRTSAPPDAPSTSPSR